MEIVKHALRFDNTAKVKAEAEMLGDSILMGNMPPPDGKPKYKAGDTVSDGPKRKGVVLGVVRVTNGYNQYAIHWEGCDAPIFEDGEWLTVVGKGKKKQKYFCSLMPERFLKLV